MAGNGERAARERRERERARERERGKRERETESQRKERRSDREEEEGAACTQKQAFSAGLVQIVDLDSKLFVGVHGVLRQRH